MSDTIELLAGFAHDPVGLDAGWSSRVRTTGPPRDASYTEWAWDCRLVGPQPLIAALMLEDGASTRYARAGRALASAELKLRLGLYLWYPPADARITVSWSQLTPQAFMAISTMVELPSPTADPREFVTIHTDPVRRLSTGALLTLASIVGEPAIRVRLVLLSASDVQSRRGGRWRVKPSLAESLPLALSWLATGQRAGEVTIGRMV